MSSNWSNNLDMLAQSGVLNFDAPAYLTGSSPRYMGSPDYINPYPNNPNSPKLKNQPKVDEFDPIQGKNKKTQNLSGKNPLWKKLLFGALATAGLIYGGIKCKKGFQWLFKGKK